MSSRRRAFWTGGAALLAALALAGVTGGEAEESLGLPALFRLRGAVAEPPGVAVVAIDSDSAKALGLPTPPTPWPRSVIARLIDEISRAGAPAIALDIVFRGPRDGDGELALALHQADRAVLLQGSERRETPVLVEEHRIDPEPALLAVAPEAPFPLPKSAARIERVWTFWSPDELSTLPAAALQAAARDVAPDWAGFLTRASPQFAGLGEATRWVGPHMTDTMALLRHCLKADPTLSATLRHDWRTLAPALQVPLDRLLRLYEGDDDRLLNLRGPAGTIRTVEASDLLGPPGEVHDAAARAIAGRVIFVGADELRSTRQVDAYATVFRRADGLDVPGVEIAATAYADLAEGTSITAPFWIGVTVDLGVAAALGLAAAGGGATLIVGALVLIATLVALCWSAFVGADLAVPLAVPLWAEIPAGLLAGAWQLRQEERQLRRRIDAAIRQYLPAELVHALASGPFAAERLAGRTRYAACVSSDVEQFTSVSERLDPLALTALLNDYFRTLFAIVRRHQGMICTVAGDGMMCAWPAAQEDEAVRRVALAAAIEMAAAVRSFNARHPESMLPTRFGVHAGSVVLGPVGGGGHYATTVVGDVANTASRLESLNKTMGTRLLASTDALARVAGIESRPLGTVLLAGKTRPIEVVEILVTPRDATNDRMAPTFAAALVAMGERRWEAAEQMLEALQREHPEDGPTRHFLQRARACAAVPPPVGEELLLRMDRK